MRFLLLLAVGVAWWRLTHQRPMEPTRFLDGLAQIYEEHQRQIERRGS